MLAARLSLAGEPSAILSNEVRSFGAVGPIVALVGISLPIAVQAQPTQPTTLVVINLARDQAAGAKHAAAVRKRLKSHKLLEPIQDGLDAEALERPLPESPAARAEREARAALAEAEAELGSFQYKRALGRVSEGERQARSIPPGPAQRKLLAELAFTRGLGELGEQNRGKAREAFELAIRLDPERASPDPAIYDPLVVALWAGAKRRTAAKPTSRLTIEPELAAAAVFVNGVEVGAGRVTVDLVPGDHEIAAALPGYSLSARRIVVGEGDAAEILRLFRQTRFERALEIRRALLAKKSLSRAELIAATAEIVRAEGADGAFVIRGDGPLEVAALRRDGNVMTRFRPASGFEELFAVYVKVAPLDLGAIPEPPVDQPWWRQGMPVAYFLGGIGLTSVIGVLVVSLSNDGPNRRTATCCDTLQRSLR